MAKLSIISGPDRGKVYDLSTQGWATSLGRQAADIVLNDVKASRLHAELSFRDGLWTLMDRGSSNGTLINGHKIDRPVHLKHNDQVRIGSSVILFESDEGLRNNEPDEEKLHQWDDPRVDSSETFSGVDISSLLERPDPLEEAGHHAVHLSHGIKNILQAVKGGREVMDHALKTNNMDNARKAWGILDHNLDLIQKLVLDMLEYSRKRKPNLVKCDVNKIVTTAVQTLRGSIEQEGKTIELHIDEQIPPARLDSDRIYDVILNLTLNAIYAVEPKTGKVTIETLLEPNKNTIKLTVSDNGPGIDDVDSVFEPFRTSKSKDSVGLGLPIARKNILQHNGTVEVQSKPGQGCAFIVRLPLNPEH